MDASTVSGASPWRSCARWELTGGARSDVWASNVAEVLSPVGHVDDLDFDSVKAMLV